MTALTAILAGLFLPLFPLSMAFNRLLQGCRHVALRIALFLIWPQVGLALILALDVPVPAWIVAVAVLTSALYAFRALALREVGQWSGFLVTSAWALLWIPLQSGTDAVQLHLFALGFSAPFVLLSLVGARLERDLGAAYAGLTRGLAESIPRLAGVLVVVVLAIVATPLFPGFFIMLATILQAAGDMPAVAAAVGGIWMFWSWAGASLLQGLIVGPADSNRGTDLSLAAAWGYALALAALAAAGLFGLGGLP